MFLDLQGDTSKLNIMLLPDKTNEAGLKRIAEELGASFITDKENLIAALSLIGAVNLEDLLGVVSGFFHERINMKELTIGDIQKINLKKLAYEFIEQIGFSKPNFSSAEERAIAVDVFFKLGRLYIHDILFPELVESNPNAAYSLLNLLKRTVSSIAIGQKFDKRAAFDLLMLHDIEIPLHPSLTGTLILGKDSSKFQLTRSEYIKTTDLYIKEIGRIAERVYEYGAIRKKSAFVAAINSGGADIEPMEIHSEKEKLIVHLFYRMWHPYVKKHKRIIYMSKGKAIWDFLQENIVDENGEFLSRDLSKTSSDINCLPGHEKIITDIEKILKPIFDQYNPR